LLNATLVIFLKPRMTFEKDIQKRSSTLRLATICFHLRDTKKTYIRYRGGSKLPIELGKRFYVFMFMTVLYSLRLNSGCAESP
jgi:hypothetical protein